MEVIPGRDDDAPTPKGINQGQQQLLGECTGRFGPEMEPKFELSRTQKHNTTFLYVCQIFSPVFETRQQSLVLSVFKPVLLALIQTAGLVLLMVDMFSLERN
jgi:hypothetical protein